MAKFKTSARTVDMLGRQQIAGIPTAMSELYKNAYDAYATEVRADYFPGLRILTLRDNGLGMSEEDFLQRWLTIGTDSKAAGSTLAATKIPAGFARRQQMGEKGIGRLAIASIAPLVFVATRADREGRQPAITCALVPWTLFETPGLTLEEIEIPTRVVNVEDSLPDALADLITEVEADLDRFGDRLAGRLASIRGQLSSARGADLGLVLSFDGPSIRESAGTTFVLFETGEDLDSSVSVEKPGDVSEFQRFLGGFANTITRPEETVPISTAFLIHEATGESRDLIGRSSFWHLEDFETVDHVIEGRFDEAGSFTGTVTLYRGDPVEYSIGTKFAVSRCGPFDIKIGVLQGESRESRVPLEDYVRMRQRLNAQGGLYIYRDNIRVLPYGNSDFDYLEIERRRTLNAGRHYFSHRRMFGAIEFSASENPGLQEKAGREGFRKNAAYRDFVELMQNFLGQLALDFFQPDGEFSDEFYSRRQLLTNRANARADKEKREAKARHDFVNALERIEALVEDGAIDDDLEALRRDALAQAENLAEGGAPASAWETLLSSVRASGRSLTTPYRLRRPISLALTSEQDRDFRAVDALAKGVISKIETTIEETCADVVSRATDTNAPLVSEPTVSAVLAGHAADAIEEIQTESVRARDTTEKLLRTLLAELAGNVTRVVSTVEAMVEPDRGQVSDDWYARQRAAIDAEVDRTVEYLERTRESVERAILDPDVLLDNRQLQERVLDLEDEVENNVELMQLGLAVQLVNHELDANIAAVRLGLRRLQPWARANRKLAVIVEDIRAAFQHLDGYLRMFTPLQRRLYRRRIDFTGSDLVRFGRGVFQDRLERHDVSLVSTPEFDRLAMHGYPSSFYPVLLNLIDNAIYWTQQADRPRRIQLDAADHGFTVSDSGPGVAERDVSAIFERGFSRRRGGRGLGLSLAEQILSREGWSLEVRELKGELGGAVFLASPRQREDQ